MSLQTQLASLISSIGADIKALQAAVGGTPNRYNSSIANQSVANANTTVTGSTIAVPAGKIKAGTIYRVKFNAVKTAAGVATPILTVTHGPNGQAVLDTVRATLTFAAQTGAIDEGEFEVECVFRSAGATAVIQAVGRLWHRLATTGLNTQATFSQVLNTGGSFDVTGAGNFLSLGINAGASAAWTISVVTAELINLA